MVFVRQLSSNILMRGANPLLRKINCLVTAMILIFYFTSAGLGYDVTDRFSIGGVIAGAYQYQSVDTSSGSDNRGKGALPFQPEFSFRPTEKDELFAKFGFATGNALNDGTSPFVLASWAADLEADVKDIHGRGRDYLLTAWYKHTFKINNDNTVSLTGGIIDGTDYLDENAFANDEYTQFMNEALVNGPNGFAPSYDLGGAVEWELGKWCVKSVVMNIGENDDGNNFTFLGVQLGYTLDTAMGEGNYRVIYEGSPNKAFSDPTGTKLETRQAVLLSFDQQFGNILGGWIRFGTQTNDAAIKYKSIYSGGINLSGALWGQVQDNIGIGYGYLHGANTGINYTQVAEGYARFALNCILSITLDVQYMQDNYHPWAGDDIDGWITSTRLTAQF